MANLNNITPMKGLPPFLQYFRTIGIIPASYKATMTYEEQILELMRFIRDEIIPKINENVLATQELQEKFKQLVNYVNEYFDNLDVQEEINNKLDEMAEGGQLEEIIAEYLQLASLLCYNTVNDMKNATNLINGSFAKTYGRNTYNDGKGEFYKIRNILNTDVVDNINIIALDNPDLVAELIKDEKITFLQEKMIENSKNNKYITCIFCDNEYRQSIAYVRELLTRSSNAGFKESQMTIHINNDGTITEDATKFAEYNNIANELRIPITSVKFHGDYNSTNYINTIIEMLQYFPNATTVFIFNEQLQYIVENGLTYPNLIKTAFPNITKVGFTCAYNQCFYGNNLTENEWNLLDNNFDILGANIYPSVSTFIDSAYCNYENVINAFNYPNFICPWKKEIWITESGVLPYWQFMELPENYRVSNLTDLTKTTEPQKLFYRALANSNIAQKANKIIPWYIESGMSDENHELFDILKNIILSR